MTTFYICRHGQSEYNLQRRIQGQIDTPLTGIGIANARSTAQKLTGITVDHIYSSDLGRAMHTAFIVCKHLGCIDKIVFAKQLRETSFGDYAGMPIDEALQKFPGFYGNENFQPPNGESLIQSQKRVLEFVFDLSSKHSGKKVLLITHDTIINNIRSKFNAEKLGSHNPNDFVAKFTTESNHIMTFQEITRQ